MVWKSFEESLSSCKTTYHVQVGDLFDQMHVPETVILRAANQYKYWARVKPSTKFVIIRGNHDASRDSSRKSSFDVFAELLAGVPNIKVMSETVEILGSYGFMPWHP